MLVGAPEVATAAPVARWKNELRAARDALRTAYPMHVRPQRLLVQSARLGDGAWRSLWAELGPPQGGALLAVGGYGRGELFPHSDVDVLVLLPRTLSDTAGAPADAKADLERFIRVLWDTGLEIGHSVRTIDECETEMANDVTIRTSLLEHRLLIGSRALYQRFR